MSSDGKYQTAVVNSGQIYGSSNYGATWASLDGNSRYYYSVAMSSDGKYQTAVVFGGQIYGSSNYGVTWSSLDSNSRNYHSVAMSSDGKYQTAVVWGGQIYGSSNYGTSWTSLDSNSINYWSIAMSSDGKYQTAVVNGGQIYGSSNYGVTWSSLDSNSRGYYSVAMSSDGKYQTAVVYGGGIYGSIASSYVLGNVGIGTTTPAYNLDVAGTINSWNLLSNNLLLGTSSASLITAFKGFNGYTNFSGGIGTGGVDSILNAQRLTSQGNLTNIGSYQGGEMLLTRGGTFASAVSVPAGTQPNYVAFGDLNGDGRLDMVASVGGDNKIDVFMNNGNGTFAAAVNYSFPDTPLSVSIGDLNGDGKADIVVTTYSSNHVFVLINNGDGTFAPAVGYTTAYYTLESTAIGDLNGDGKADLAVTANNGAVIVLINNGNGTFAAGVNYTSGGSNTNSVAIGDLNGDGKADIVAANYTGNNISVFMNNGNGTFAAGVNYTTGTHPNSVAIGDLNGDGKADIVAANYGSGNISVFMNNGNGTFPATGTTYATATDPVSTVISDMNGDGKADIVVANETDTISILMSNGGGGFTTTSYPTGHWPLSLAVGDLNGDGKPDMATANYGSNDVSVLLNKATPMLYAQASTGNVGIGTTAPLVTLDVRGNSGTLAIASVSGKTAFAGLVVDNSGLGDLITASASGVEQFAVNNAGELFAKKFTDLNDKRYFLDPASTGTSLTTAGAVGIGNTSPVGKLDLTGAIIGKALAIFNETGDQALFTASASGVTKFVIDHSGNVGIGTTTTTTFKLQVAGNIGPDADNTYNLGSSPSGRFASLFVGPASLHIQCKTTDAGCPASQGIDYSLAINSAGTLGIGANVGAANPADIFLTQGGSIGIQTSTPNHTFDVNGNIGLTAGKYINFGAIDGTGGYGLFDNGGTIQIKNSGGSWVNIPTSSTTQWSNSGSNIYFSTGNVGIGTTAPNDQLQVGTVAGVDSGGGDAHFTGNLYYDTSASAWKYITANYGAVMAILPSTGDIGFYTAASGAAGGTASTLAQKMVILNGGNVGIGTTAPAATLTTYGGVAEINVMTVAGAEALDWPTAGLSIRRIDDYTTMRMLQLGHSADSTYQTGSSVWNLSLVDNVGSKTTSDANTDLNINGPGDLILQPAGNVGIGTTSPSQKLTLRYDSSVVDGLGFEDTRSGYARNWKIGAGVGSGNYFSIYDTTAGRNDLKFDTTGYATFAASHNDLAENYLLNGAAKRGEIIGFDPQNKIQVGLANSNQSIMGVISTKPGAVMDATGGFTIGGDTKENYANEKVPVAAVGSVPVIVIGKPGSIVNGDAIALSTIPGVGAKATTAGKIVGNALEANNNWNAQSCPTVTSLDSITWPEDDSNNSLHPCFQLSDGTYVGKIMVFLNIGWNDPQVQLTDTGNLNLVDNTATADAKFTIPHYFTLNDVLGNPLQRVGEFSDAAIANLRAGIVNAQQVTTNALSVATENVTIGGQSLRNYIASIVSEIINQQSLINNQGFISPIASADEIHTNFISP
jgi:hypothetical protein